MADFSSDSPASRISHSRQVTHSLLPSFLPSSPHSSFHFLHMYGDVLSIETLRDPQRPPKLTKLLITVLKFEYQHKNRSLMLPKMVPKIRSHSNYCNRFLRCVKFMVLYQTAECTSVRTWSREMLHYGVKSPTNYKGWELCKLRRKNSSPNLGVTRTLNGKHMEAGICLYFRTVPSDLCKCSYTWQNHEQTSKNYSHHLQLC